MLRGLWNRAAMLVVALVLVSGTAAQAAPDADKPNAETFSLDKEGKYAAAAQVAERALSISEKAQGPNHLQVAAVLNKPALLYKRQERFAEASPLLRIEATPIQQDKIALFAPAGNGAYLVPDLDNNDNPPTGCSDVPERRYRPQEVDIEASRQNVKRLRASAYEKREAHKIIDKFEKYQRERKKIEDAGHDYCEYLKSAGAANALNGARASNDGLKRPATPSGTNGERAAATENDKIALFAPAGNGAFQIPDLDNNDNPPTGCSDVPERRYRPQEVDIEASRQNVKRLRASGYEKREALKIIDKFEKYQRERKKIEDAGHDYCEYIKASR